MTDVVQHAAAPPTAAPRTAPAVTTARPGTPPPATRGPRRLLGALPEVGVALTGLAVYAWQLGTPQAWRDESATMIVADRSVAGITRLVQSIDLVHYVYYLLARLVVVVHPTVLPSNDVTAVRWLSVIAAVLTSVVLVRIGRSLDSPAAGVVAGLALAASPLVSRYAQEARSYALVMLAASLSTWAFVHAVRRPWRRRRWGLYGLALALCPVLHVISVLVAVAHGLYALVATAPRVRRAWFVTTAVTGALLVPWMLLALGQRQQLWWLVTAPSLGDLQAFFAAQYGTLWPVATIGAVTLAWLVVAWRGAGRSGALGAVAAWPVNRRAGLLGLAWAVLPVLALWVMSQVHPFFSWRYLIFTLPGTALAVGAWADVALRVPLRAPALSGLLARRARSTGEAPDVDVPLVVGSGPAAATALDAHGDLPPRGVPRRAVLRVPRLGAAVALVALAGAGLHMQQVYRDPVKGHAEDLRGVATYISAHAHAGDAIVFVPGEMRRIMQLYPELFTNVQDVALLTSPLDSDSISGVERSPSQLRTALSGYRRVWVVTGENGVSMQYDTTDAEKAALIADHFKFATAARFTPFQVLLCVPARSTGIPDQQRGTSGSTASAF